ncbi:amidase [Roseisolibacter sp. H3M3-2]|uniref:amidase n=1 Tax=Roseisolibacter sp. H3M3-2 TaxID=3031323 RepID=UPI0023D99C27|nr:amidase [Roseisolibacter sp. H3M3-2]MDF1503804.1 amidase [Roseisolibacter sp. H3M3-2]
MDRRTFLEAGALGAAALAAGRPLAAAPAPAPVAAAGAAGAFQDFAFAEATVADLQGHMAAGRHSARAIAQAYLARIEAVDRAGPTLRSVIEVNPDALAQAEAMDAERRAGRVRGPLHGIPVLLKDNVDTGDRMLTTAGSLALVGAPAARDAFVAARLREAGAVLLGKTNLSEWANFRSTRSSSGWSGRGGQTRNPYVLDRSPCGSSSGSGAAVAANLAALAVGTETDGSIVCPSSANGLVGLKPTLGLVSRSGIVPIAHSQDTAGPMTRTVRDAAVLLSVLASGGADPRDGDTRAAQRHVVADYAAGLDAGALRGARIGVARQFFGFHPQVDALMADALRALRDAGAVLVDEVKLPTRGQFDDGELEVLLWEFKADLDAYLAGRTGVPVRSLADVIAFNERERAREMPWFGQELMLRAQAKTGLADPKYRATLARNRRLAGAQGIDAMLAGTGGAAGRRLDAIVAPTGGPAWAIDLLNGDHFGGGWSSPSAVAGYPHVTVPAGQVGGLPVGLSFAGAAWSERRLLGYAYAYEQATRHRRAPTFRPTLLG